MAPLFSSQYFQQNLNSKVPLNKAHGLYSCPTRLLECARHILTKPIMTLENISAQEGRFPSTPKLFPSSNMETKMIPVIIVPYPFFYYFIAFLKNSCITVYFNKNDVFYCSQYGFQEQRSTEHAILDIANKIQLRMDKGLYRPEKGI